MIGSRVGAAGAVAAGLGWGLAFGSTATGIRLEWLEGLAWLLPLGFGMATVGLWGTRTTGARTASSLAASVAVLASASQLAGSVLAETDWVAYAAWLAFVLGVTVLLILVLAYGIAHWRDARDRPVARVATLVGGLPVAFVGLIFGYKLLTGWWVTDPALLAFGSIGGSLLIGGGWIALGAAMWARRVPMREPIASVPGL